MLERLKAWAREVKRDVVALWLAARDARTPAAAKVLGAAVVAYALSPIDLIPDFIPVLGLIDDAVLVPLGVWATVQLIPGPLMDEFRRRAEATSRPVSRAGAIAVVMIWAGIALLLGLWMWSR